MAFRRTETARIVLNHSIELIGRPSVFFRGTGLEMCEQCVEIDKKIENYQRMASRITDQAMLDGIKGLIEQMQAQKTALHPEQAK
jgi:ATP-dependent protease ClpP protease subunit